MYKNELDADLVTWIEKALEFTANYPVSNSLVSSINLVELLNIKLLTVDAPITLEDVLSRYPILKNILDSYSFKIEDLVRYTQLEDYKRNTL
jgi:hypothetical protein